MRASILLLAIQCSFTVVDDCSGFLWLSKRPITAAASRIPTTSSPVGNLVPLFESASPSSQGVADSSGVDDEEDNDEKKHLDQNTKYIRGLIENLMAACDKWICNGSQATRERAMNILSQIEQEAYDKELVLEAKRLLKRSGMPMLSSASDNIGKSELGKTDSLDRRKEAEKRQKWEDFRSKGENVNDTVARSALSRRQPDPMLDAVIPRLENAVADKVELQRKLDKGSSGDTTNSNDGPMVEEVTRPKVDVALQAATRSAELVAQAGAKGAFEGETTGIGGLDDVLAQVKRRIWVPLAAPPKLLNELGISPVRGLLLYGRPGCGKTLIARTIGRILSPMRPITVVSGPEIMDKFVGSSEKNLREIFDNPPDIYDQFRLDDQQQPSKHAADLSVAALHVVVMDEFDAVARTRGGRGGKGGEQGDAGVARDSVVNQLLAKMDGVEPLPVPTLVIGMTNKRSLIEPALLRAGRFEVQIEVPPPRTKAQRISILKVHTKAMYEAGRLLVSDAPPASAADELVKSSSIPVEGLPTYEELLSRLADECADMMSGAAIAGVARAAASHALERAVVDFADKLAEAAAISSTHHPALDCVVTMQDFELAVQDVYNSSGATDWEEETDAEEEQVEEKPEKVEAVESGSAD